MDIKGKKVLVTGADGFIGSHLVEALIKRGAQVKALSYYNSFNYWGNLEGMEGLNKIDVLSGDIRDPHYCYSITKDVDVIFNLAALIAIPYSYVAPNSYVDTNITGTINICQAAMQNKISRLIQTSTSEVYGTALYVPMDEKHPLQPQSPYSASKIGSDAMAMSYYNSFDLPLSIARPFNTYGPRQSARAVIPTIITQIANGKKEIIIGDYTTLRDFSFVEDTCAGLINICECDEAIGEVVNIGSNSEISIENLFNTIAEIMKSDAKIKTDEKRIRPSKSEVKRLWCDNSKYVKLTGKKPIYDIRTGLTKTIEWFTNSENLKRYKADIYNL